MSTIHGAPSIAALRAFGAGLHLLQDSYSHEGAYVGNLNDQQEKYGGWRLGGMAHAPKAGTAICHPDRPEIQSRCDRTSTDETSADVPRAVEMAHTTFEALVDFRLRSGVIGAEEARALREEWAPLKPIIQKFAEARTKQSKKEWLRKYEPRLQFTDAVLDDMSIPE